MSIIVCCSVLLCLLNVHVFQNVRDLNRILFPSESIFGAIASKAKENIKNLGSQVRNFAQK